MSRSAPVDAGDLVMLVGGLSSLRMDDYAVVGSHTRYDEHVRGQLKNARLRIAESCAQPGRRRDNHLVWAAPEVARRTSSSKRRGHSKRHRNGDGPCRPSFWLSDRPCDRWEARSTRSPKGRCGSRLGPGKARQRASATSPATGAQGRRSRSDGRRRAVTTLRE
jgi:hypothetical protein